MNIKTIDMRQEYKKNNFGMISWYLRKRIQQELEKGNNITLILNRKPYSTFIMCRECGYVMRCSNCKSNLYYDIIRRVFYCPVCGYSVSPTEKCPKVR